ncbi:hypothetical protein CYMTET_6458 [Cymbomonas tetramitiformis]|uniref:Uncharacterized protein n=1 Tax=Cymbomonas tetramitiformis TaxID=36881 RepID=A0AAE0GXF0_9CHLO|nr:hypothetical protein CYMTET_6458 [Cymbomonas tetramitiformis]
MLHLRALVPVSRNNHTPARVSATGVSRHPLGVGNRLLNCARAGTNSKLFLGLHGVHGRQVSHAVFFEDQDVGNEDANVVKESPDLEDSGSSVEGSEPASFTADDMQVFNAICAAGTWEDVQAKVQQLDRQGQGLKGVLAAGAHVLDLSKTRGESEGIIQAIENVCKLLTMTLEKAFMPPSFRLVDRFMQMDPEDESVGQKLKTALEEQGVSTLDFDQAVSTFILQMDSENEQIDKAIEDAPEEEKSSILQIAEARKETRARMVSLRELGRALEA